jgi:hypothetical protein
MKSSTKIIAVLSLLGTVGIAGLPRNVYAAQSPQPQVAEVNDATKTAKNLPNNVPQNTKIAEVSDGDGETNDNSK